MNDYLRVSRKDVGEDRIAICPIFGCEYMKRVKPLRYGFFGFCKYPKCKKHHVPLVYIDERIGEFVNGALACLFDKAGLPPRDLLLIVASKYPDEMQSFVHGWVYCITTGRGAPIVSHYLDSISKAYLKKLNRKQVEVLQKEGSGKHAGKYEALEDGLKTLTTQYARLLKHIRVHSEVFMDVKSLKSLSSELRHDLKKWQKGIIKDYLSAEIFEKGVMKDFAEIKRYFDHILNVGTCRYLIGMNSEIKKIKITGFDRFSAYEEFHSEGITEKFTKSDLKKLETTIQLNKHLHSNGLESENNNNVNLLNPNNEDFPIKCKNSKKGGKIKVQNVKCCWEQYHHEDFKNYFFNLILKMEKSYTPIEQELYDFDYDFLKAIKQKYGSYGDFLSMMNEQISSETIEYFAENKPLYKCREWLSYLYYDLNFSLRKIGDICGVDHCTISNWAKKYNFQFRENKGEWIDNRGGYKRIYTPEGYFHPDYVPNDRGDGRYILQKHRYLMEIFLRKNPQLTISKKFLIDGKYLTKDCVIHHINFDKLDNRIENLWIFNDQGDHVKSRDSLFQSLSVLIKLGKISFTKKFGYRFNRDFNISSLSKSQISKLLKPHKIFFKNIENVKEDIKNIDWEEISSNWIVQRRQNQFTPYETLILNPYVDCSENNPLYMHKDWLQTIVNEEKYNLSDSRLGELCSITKDVARYWRRTLIVSRGRNWGFSHFINADGRVWIKPKNYNNPIALNNGGYVLEHRFNVERDLNSQIGSELARRCLDSQGFLRTDIIIHHIDFDPSNNQTNNLYILFSRSKHKKLEFSILKHVKELLETHLIQFNNGIYEINL